MKKIFIIFAIIIILGLTACSSKLSDKEAVQLATNQYFEKALQELRQYEPQATRRQLNMSVEGSEVLSNDGVNAIVKLNLKQKDDPRIGLFGKPFSVEIEVTQPE